MEEVEEVEEVEEQQQQQQKACRWLLLTTANLYTSAIERTIAPCTRGSWIACWSPDDGSVLQQKVLSLKGVDFRWVFLYFLFDVGLRSLTLFVRSFVRSPGTGSRQAWMRSRLPTGTRFEKGPGRWAWCVLNSIELY